MENISEKPLDENPGKNVLDENSIKKNVFDENSVKNILLGCTGSVASIKIPLLVEQIQRKIKSHIKLLPTEKAKHFFSIEQVIYEAKRPVDVYSDEQEWMQWQSKGDPVLHIGLRRWADILIIAPLDANTLAKISGGLCDNLLTCVVRAWDVRKPLLFAPAMNTMMWEHPLTNQQINILKSFGYKEIPCVAKTLACNDVGQGAMAEVHTIVDYIQDALRR